MRFSGSAYGAVTVALLALFVAGCSSIPYEVAIPKSVAAQLERDREAETPLYKNAISLCYSRRINTPEDLMAEAQLICGGGQVKYLDSDSVWTPCSLLQPSRATFICTPAP